MSVTQLMGDLAEDERFLPTIKEIVELTYGDSTRVAGFSRIMDRSAYRICLILAVEDVRPETMVIDDSILAEAMRKTARGLAFMGNLRTSAERQRVDSERMRQERDARRAVIRDEFEGYDVLFEQRAS